MGILPKHASDAFRSLQALFTGGSYLGLSSEVAALVDRPALVGFAPRCLVCWDSGMAELFDRHYAAPWVAGELDVPMPRGGFCPCAAGVDAKTAYEGKVARQRFVLDAKRLLDQDTRLERAGVPPEYRGWTFDRWRTDGNAQRERVLEFARLYTSGEFHGRPGVYLHGPQGRGKTTLAVSMLDVLTQHLGVDGLYVNWALMLRDLRDSYSNKTGARASADIVREAESAPVVVIDDVGDPDRSGAFSDHTREVIYLIMEQRKAWRRPTILTSNVGPNDLDAQFGERVAGRIRQHCTILPVLGDNYRLGVTS